MMSGFKASFIGAKHYKGVSKEGKDYEFDSVAFLDRRPDDRVKGNWVVVGTTPSDNNPLDLIPGKEYVIYPSYNNGRCTIDPILEV